jgi:hypothetical protein
MSEPVRDFEFRSPPALDPESGIRQRVETRALAEARRAWEAEDMWDDDIELSTFEWDTDIKEHASAHAGAVTQPFPLLTVRDARRGDVVAPRAALHADAGLALSSRPALARTVGVALLAALLVGFVLIVATPPGWESIASWATLGHTDHVKRVLQPR